VIKGGEYQVTKLYVGNLPFATTDQELGDFFAEYGPVSSATVIMDKRTGRSKGFGFVELENDEMANSAIEALNGVDFGGRNIVVNVARPKRDDDATRGGAADSDMM